MANPVAKVLLVASVCFAALLLPASHGAASDSEAVVIEGIVKLDVPVRLKSSAVELLLDTGKHAAFVRTNGYFQMRITPGTHYLLVSAVGATFPQVRLDVSAKHKGRFKATVLHEGAVLGTSADELTISALGPEVYFDARQPFNAWSLLKSPMGIMVAVMVVGMVVMPYLMEGIDPEEVKQVQEQMRSQPMSINNLLSAAAGSGTPSAGRS